MQLGSLFKWLFIVVGGIVGIAVLGFGVVYVLIERDLDRTFASTGTSVTVPTDSDSIAEGARLARIRGCNDGCHGDGTGGQIFFEAPDGTRVVAPDLGRIAAQYSVAELEQAIRYGIRPDGTSVIIAMPSSMFYHLSEDELGAIIAFLKNQPIGAEPLPETWIGPLARAFFFYYKQRLGTILAAEHVDDHLPRIDASRNSTTAYGYYLAATICSECHGTDLRGGPDQFAPTLAIVAAYSIDNFRLLMREGRPIGDRELDLMARVAESRFSHLTDVEIESLHAYLRTLAESAPEPL